MASSNSRAVSISENVPRFFSRKNNINQRPVSAWTDEEVLHWLETKELHLYIPIFKRNEISGSILQEMDHYDLELLGISEEHHYLFLSLISDARLTQNLSVPTADFSLLDRGVFEGSPVFYSHHLLSTKKKEPPSPPMRGSPLVGSLPTRTRSRSSSLVHAKIKKAPLSTQLFLYPPLSEWTEQHVKRWLKEVNLKVVWKKFKNQSLDGGVLSRLTDSDLRSLKLTEPEIHATLLAVADLRFFMKKRKTVEKSLVQLTVDYEEDGKENQVTVSVTKNDSLEDFARRVVEKIEKKTTARKPIGVLKYYEDGDFVTLSNIGDVEYICNRVSQGKLVPIKFVASKSEKL
eukprot:CAMPEP_0201485220 /NCGR_PEP_ID=MMETSP0151_2-20130828/9345_1 /ASSEMBLY_ACC=CAM_ASM_000257 /TAXON_ID=200890 /ORGANISM="Paramoeba atlantica, Strain 621/1 / CCAP 1560/9" /LENGTH=345 /DNA_ID=CAMNT_0047869249 /DNA_START=30 /DNA_END=1064 /DNA_ORIENTATION=-